MNYSLIVPYFKTPEVTRLCLYSIFKFSGGNPEVIVVDNAPDSAESATRMFWPVGIKKTGGPEHVRARGKSPPAFAQKDS
ncbi:MAG: hypothetical protein K0Q55_3621 [Verrucomicrobia bacterium]|nr:hypothetical protein [Verrucomicrobiota bacterium]